ncbi:MAG: sodium:solute symporter family protein [Dehalococcoidia bacterium]|nr:sodium:solute symporter family protein [Dehalococcoidia bacterium]MDH4292437.1 sodium:solute symporter family protein [Dehalococcoidia bacterium]
MIQLVIVVVYSLLMIGIGLGARKKAGSQNGFFVAQRQINVAFITGSFVATAVGGSVTVGMAGLGFGRGLTGVWWLLVGSIGLVLLGAFFARKVRGAALYTLPELVERQYGRRVGLAASILIVIAWVGVVAGQIVAAGKVLSILGIGSGVFWMVIFTIVFVAYTVIGGQLSVIRTDLFQAIIICLGIFIALASFLPQAGGLQGLRLSLPQDFFSFPVSAQFDWKALLSLLILVGATYVVGPDMYTRLFCAKNEKTAQRATFLSASSFIPLAFAIVLIGMGARVLYPNISPEQAFPQVISGVLSPWLGGFVLAALVAALMSSADTCLLSQGVILTRDIIGRFLPSLSEKKTILLTRLNIIILGLLALGLAMVLKGVITSLLFAYTIFTCGLVVPVIAGFYKEKLRVTPQGALAALVGGGIIGLLGKIPGLDIPFKGDLGLIGFGVSAVLLFGVSYLGPRMSGGLTT